MLASRLVPMLLILTGFAGTALAVDPVKVRWTAAEDQDASIGHVLAEVAAKTGVTLKEADLRVGDDRDLAFNHYKRYDQVLSDLTIHGMSLRVWTDLESGALIQLEAQLEPPGAQPLVALTDAVATAARTDAAKAQARRLILDRGEDLQVRSVEVQRYWQAGRLVVEVKVKAHRGAHSVRIDALTSEVLSQKYSPYERADLDDAAQAEPELSVMARIYPIYEEYKKTKLPRVLRKLKHLDRAAPRPTEDPFAGMRSIHYFSMKQDEVLGNTEAGRALGYWSMGYLKKQAWAIRDALPKAPNDFLPGDDVQIQGKYATVSIYPEAFDKFPGITIPKRLSPQLYLNWQNNAAAGDWEVIPSTAAVGTPLTSRRDALTRDSVRDPNHNPAVYINNGYDEVQVYWSVTELFEALRPLGFRDPDLAERPFHAFLFDPDVESKDNAFYTDDTINFTTYSPSELNEARDNTTIWHELGHGVMDRLMGPLITLADTGGLSEGMADFVAQMVIYATNGTAPFPGDQDQRIINQTGFFLTNEVHDDGEAYGGTMKAVLDAAYTKWGRRGLHKVVDVVLEAMRLTRDNPGLTAQDWFDHIAFADSLGRPGVRAKGELKPLIDAALTSRNFAADGHRALFSLSYQGKEVVAGQPGSRDNEIPLTLAANATSTHELTVKLIDGDRKWQYPVEVRTFFNSGPLEGAIHWEGEEHEPEVHVLSGPDDLVKLELTVRGTCDRINRTDGTCSDFAYVQIWEKGATKPAAKKRFYLRIKTT